MTYTQSQIDSIRAHILNIGFTVNEQGCEVWNSSGHQRQPQFYLPLKDGRKVYVNVRTFIWKDANEGSSTESTHTSCGNTHCIKVEHIVPGRKKRNVISLPYVFTESEISVYHQKITNGVTHNERGCHIWGGDLTTGKTPSFTGNNRNINIARFLWTRVHEDFNAHSKHLNKTCGDIRCINLEHLFLESKKKKFDREHLWKLLLQKTTKIDDCLVLKHPGIHGYGLTSLLGTTMASHRASYIINKNGGKPIPSVDEKGHRLVIRHICPRRQPDCVNPDHLELGTQMENMFEDRIKAGTIARGVKNPVSKITEDVAQDIKNSLWPVDHPEYLSIKDRAEKFGATVGIVSAIDRKTAWTYLPDRDGVVTSNEEQRSQNRKRQRSARTASWSEEDFNAASEKIRSNTVESSEGKAGQLPPGDCWIWQKSKNRLNYGITSFKGKNTKSHILSLEAKYKRFMKPGEVVRHLCDNNPCSRPDHLVFGSRKENQRDIQLYGNSKRSKVTPDIVRLIRVDTNASCSHLAEKYGISRSCVNRIRSGATWSYVD